MKNYEEIGYTLETLTTDQVKRLVSLKSRLAQAYAVYEKFGMSDQLLYQWQDEIATTALQPILPYGVKGKDWYAACFSIAWENDVDLILIKKSDADDQDKDTAELVYYWSEEYPLQIGEFHNFDISEFDNNPMD